MLKLVIDHNHGIILDTRKLSKIDVKYIGKQITQVILQ